MAQLEFDKKYILETRAVRLEPLEEKHFPMLKSISQSPDIWTYFLEEGYGEKKFKNYFQSAIQKKKSI